MTVHWWHTNKLVKELAADGVSEEESVGYAMVSTALYTAAIYWAAWMSGSRSWMLLWEFLVILVISLVGVHECFKANGGSQGSRFLKRMYCLSVPVGLKVAVAGGLLSWIIVLGFPHVVTHENFRNPYFVYQLLSYSCAGAITVIYYWRMTIHLKNLSKS